MKSASSGMALVTALLVVAIASLAATALLSSVNIAVHRTAALRDSEQGWWVARGVEAWVLGILQQDANERDYDGLDEAWAMPVDHLPVDQGHVRGAIVDLQGRFNLNNLDKRNPAWQEYEAQFRRLLQRLPEPPPANELIAAIHDWMDADDAASFPSGAEDTVYLNLDPPYRAANRPFTVPSELLAVRGVTPALYRALRDLVTALPEVTPVNLNTADPAVIRALTASPDEAKLEQFVARRAEKPLQNAADLAEFTREGVLGPDAKPQHLAFASRYFQIQGEVFVGSSRVALYSLIHRPDPGTPKVLAHSADAE